ncbi:MAG: hypothetical protein ACLP7A_00490 [Desulfobaccales bacterium]
MEPGKLVCYCEKCGNEAEMTIKCEKIKETGLPPGEPGKPRPRTLVCTRCGAEADLIYDYA